MSLSKQTRRQKYLNFAEEIYNIFRSNQTIQLPGNYLTKLYQQTYNKPFNNNELYSLPFIQFEHDTNTNSDSNSNIYLIIELDDFCCKKCKYQHCKLLHTLNKNDAFYPMYDNNNNYTQNQFYRPNIQLIQRLKEILNTFNPPGVPNSKQITLTEMIQLHNKIYPQFKTHQPTAHGINIRFKSTFSIQFVQQLRDYVIGFKYNTQSRSNSHNKQQSRHWKVTNQFTSNQNTNTQNMTRNNTFEMKSNNTDRQKTKSLKVDNLALNVTDEILFVLFNSIANVSSIQIIRDSFTGQSLGYAIVNFDSISDAQTVFHKMNLQSINGQVCQISFVDFIAPVNAMCTQTQSVINNKMFICSFHLDFIPDTRDLNQYFQRFGKITNKINIEYTSEKRPIAKVEFENIESVNTVCNIGTTQNISCQFGHRKQQTIKFRVYRSMDELLNNTKRKVKRKKQTKLTK